MKIGIIGRGEILLACAQQLNELGHQIPLVITAKEAPEYKVTREDYKRFADKVGAKYAQTAKIDSQDIYDMLFLCQPMDVAVSINYSGVISGKVMSYFNLGILNAHGGDLPRYRGNACQAWAILNGEDRIGLCIHKMVGGELDSGDIIAKSYLPIEINTRIGQVYEWIERTTPSLMLESIQKLEVHENYYLESQSKNPGDALRCYPRNPTDGRIEWTKDAKEVLKLINASSEPYSGAFCNYEDEKLIVWRAELVNEYENFLASPGQVTRIGETFIEVACLNSKLRITEMEFKGLRSTLNKVIKSIRTRLN